MTTTQTTMIKAKKDLYNAGKCFSKGQTYEVNRPVTMAASLMDLQAINDQGQKHIIGAWWREFEIITDETED